jgi:hypothetical protein
LRVYVTNKRNQPLMPTTPKKARLLLGAGKAKVVNQIPFTIQLLYATGEHIQVISLGIDAGTKHIGVSATSEKEVLFEAEIILRTDVVELLATRRAFRRARRSRKTRYRQAQFQNRRRPEGWLAPSVQNKVNTHLKIIHQVHRILPVEQITIEVAQFDIQKVNHPDIEGVGYQQGEQLGFWNVREYVFFRDGHQCQHCRGRSRDPILNVHHIESRKTGGDAPNNLITLCESCHHHIHREGLEHLFQRLRQSLRDATQMTIMRWFIYNKVKESYPVADITYGYLTKNTRICSELEKSHLVDARCISGNPLDKPPKQTFYIKQVRKNNRQLHKATIMKGGIRKASKAAKYVKGFQLFDKVRFDGFKCFIFGRRKTGYFDLRLLDGTKVHASASYKRLVLVQKSKTLLWEQKVV